MTFILTPQRRKPSGAPTLLNHWKMDDGSGVVADNAVNIYYGLLRNGATFGSDYALLGGDPPVNVIEVHIDAGVGNNTNTNNEFTVVLEYYLASSDTVRFFLAYREETAEEGYSALDLRVSPDNTVMLGVRDTNTGATGSLKTVTTTAKTIFNTWHFICGRCSVASNLLKVTLDNNTYTRSGGSALASFLPKGAGIAMATPYNYDANPTGRKLVRLRNVMTYDEYLSDVEMSALRTSLGY